VARDDFSPSVLLTPRDLALLRELARFRVLTAEQLRRRHFPGRALATCWNRLGQLKAADYVARVPLGYGHEAAWLVTGRGAAASFCGLDAPRCDGVPGAWFRHHLAVADVAESLIDGRYHGGTPSWQTEAEWSREHGGGVLRPDGVLTLTAPDGTEHLLGVEVELHPKTPRRYVPKVVWYRERLGAGDLHRVRWYVADAATRRVVSSAIRGVPGMEVLPLPVQK
jgi:hypothetical protein